MTKRDLLLRYKQTVMGFGWAIFMPVVLNTIVFSVIFMRVAPLDVGNALSVVCVLWPPGLEFLGVFVSIRAAIVDQQYREPRHESANSPARSSRCRRSLVSLVDFAARAASPCSA